MAVCLPPQDALLPPALWVKLQVWVAAIQDGQVILNFHRGEIVGYKLIESGRIAMKDGKATLDRDTPHQ